MTEPKLFAEMRAAKARAEKAAKHAPPQPVGPIMTASVVTPEIKRAPTNYIAQTLSECTTVAQCEELLAHAKQHGYSEPVFDENGALTSGQTIQLIRKRMVELGGAKPAAKAQKRGRR